MRAFSDPAAVVWCIACGARVPRADAREYDRFGDRWDRDGKTFEHLCKPCDRVESHQPRIGLEDTLAATGSTHETPAAFVRAYYRELERHPDA